jgi:hypothetical protein
MDGAPACPFVAYGDDRDGRSTGPDHRHRCFAESPPAPRALAHQEAYCLSSAFPVCPTFQDWARREAAHARGAGERAETAPSAVPSSASTVDGDEASGPEPPPRAPDDLPVRRNPPRDWAAPPPWATGAGGMTRPTGSPGAAADGGATDFTTGRSEGQGLAGSAADRLAGGSVPASGGAGDAAAAGAGAGAAGWSASAAGSAAAAPDPDLAGLVQTRPPAGAESGSGADGYGRPTRTGGRPSVSSTRPAKDAVPGPAWEGIRRYEAYPTIKTRAGLPGLPRIAVLGGAVAIAALALFMLPALLGIGGSPSASPSPSRPVATAKPSPTPIPAPSAQVYVIKTGDTLSKVAKRYNLTLEELLAANPDIKNPDKIALGQQIVIPLPGTAAPSGSAAP